MELRNSYQNRPHIGTALLWAVGLGGKKDLQVGLKGNQVLKESTFDPPSPLPNSVFSEFFILNA